MNARESDTTSTTSVSPAPYREVDSLPAARPALTEASSTVGVKHQVLSRDKAGEHVMVTNKATIDLERSKERIRRILER